MKEKFVEIKDTTVATIKNPNINVYILYSALLFSTTSLFCWCFQPLLKMSAAPVLMFSSIYVINHALRAGFSFHVNRLKKFFGFNRLLVVTTFLCIYSFACMILSFHFRQPNVAFICLIFVCIGIGFQLAFAIANINHIHNYAMEETRATISSVNNMLQQTLSGISLICFKFVIEPGSGTAGLSFASAFSVFGAFYLCLSCCSTSFSNAARNMMQNTRREPPADMHLRTPRFHLTTLHSPQQPCFRPAASHPLAASFPPGSIAPQ